jgi:hypothetical protein
MTQLLIIPWSQVRVLAGPLVYSKTYLIFAVTVPNQLTEIVHYVVHKSVCLPYVISPFGSSSLYRSRYGQHSLISSPFWNVALEPAHAG